MIPSSYAGMFYSPIVCTDSDDDDYGSTPPETPNMLPRPAPLQTHWCPPHTFELLLSTKFCEGTLYGMFQSNFRLISSDNVLYHVHLEALRRYSDNMLNLTCLNELHAVASVPEKSATLSIMLHAIYDMPFSQPHPRLQTLIEAVSVFPRYGLSPKELVRAKTHIYSAILDQTPLAPFHVYLFAAQFHLEDLAVATSAYCLSLLLSDISDESARVMGPRYLKRLFDLHLRRKKVLTRMLLVPLPMHPTNRTCTFKAQRKAANAWRRATAPLVLSARPGMTCQSLGTAYGVAEGEVQCQKCKMAIAARLKTMLAEWTDEKRTI
ncbi:hypothetical protein BDZ89DRAFT_1059199 [Hymenopellis radicata]|nr:hypothetical protein BDZ89DRAFT_1059199 [Hymenopellis radicata]